MQAAVVWSSIYSPNLVNIIKGWIIQCLPTYRDVAMNPIHIGGAEPTDDLWEKHKPLITALYTLWPLEEVQRLLEQHHGFQASYVRFTTRAQLKLTLRVERMRSSENLKNGALRRTRRQIKWSASSNASNARTSGS